MVVQVEGSIISSTFSFPIRVILSGSSGGGKTTFAKQLVSRNDLFDYSIKRIRYYFPIYLKNYQTQFHDHISLPISYHHGLPNMTQIMDMKAGDLLIFDDMYEKAVNDENIDLLFRVISRKQEISILIITQNFYAQGKFSRNIRNSCNYTVLFRNTIDLTINKRVCNNLGLSEAYKSASSDTINELFPYMFIDQSASGHASGYRLYTNIYGCSKVVYSNDGMKAYVIPEKIFNEYFKIHENNNTYSAELKNGIHQKNTIISTKNPRKNYSRSRYRTRYRFTKNI